VSTVAEDIAGVALIAVVVAGIALDAALSIGAASPLGEPLGWAALSALGVSLQATAHAETVNSITKGSRLMFIARSPVHSASVEPDCS